MHLLRQILVHDIMQSLSPAPFLAAAAAVPPAGPLVREEELDGEDSLDDVGIPELPPEEEETERVDLRPGEMGRAIRDAGAPPPPSPWPLPPPPSLAIFLKWDRL